MTALRRLAAASVDLVLPPAAGIVVGLGFALAAIHERWWIRVGRLPARGIVRAGGTWSVATLWFVGGIEQARGELAGDGRGRGGDGGGARVRRMAAA